MLLSHFVFESWGQINESPARGMDFHQFICSLPR